MQHLPDRVLSRSIIRRHESYIIIIIIEYKIMIVIIE